MSTDGNNYFFAEAQRMSQGILRGNMEYWREHGL